MAGLARGEGHGLGQGGVVLSGGGRAVGGVHHHGGLKIAGLGELTVKVKFLVPVLPSAWVALRAVMVACAVVVSDRAGGGGRGAQRRWCR